MPTAAIDTAVESKKIGEGHAFDKHVNGVKGPNGKEFENGKVINNLAFPNTTITTKSEFTDFIKEIMDNPDHTKQSGNGVKTESVASLQTIMQPCWVLPRAGFSWFVGAVAFALHAACPSQSVR